ncbi:MAG: phosphorylase, partial [Merismopedia sp. SIO2A8]|nr:phosphorylase [Merismopedia sp. SIO2A8]
MCHPTNMEQPKTLLEQAYQQSAHALRCGALQSIATDYKFVEQGGVRFLVRILTNLVRKEQANLQQKAKGKDFNPFLPYEDDLFVANLSSTHLCLLNKFNVVDHHLLIVTREFEHQENWLNYNDFAALWTGLKEIDGLAFFNGGKTAGASQTHKHLQLIPMPLAPEGEAIPIEAILPYTAPDRPEHLAQLPFANGFMVLDLSPMMSPDEAATLLWKSYCSLLKLLAISMNTEDTRASHPYNLLVTRRWMLLVPRKQEHTHSISINSLGFAGS